MCEVANKIKARRIELGLTLEDVAQAVGVGRSTVRKWETGMTTLAHRSLLAAAVATSIDALAVGVSFAFQEDVKLLPSCLLIGCTTFVISFLGAMLGSRIPGLSGRKAGIVGGLVLIGIGVKLLVEGVILK